MADAETSAQVDEEAPLVDQMSPEGDVFSYSLMAAPKQMKKHNTFTYDAAMSYLLVALVLAMQGIMLLCVYDNVVVENGEWQDGIMKVDEDWGVFEQAGNGCKSGHSLCTVDNGTYSCAPPSVQLTGRWNELDTNGDGIWTKEEVLKSRDQLKCKYVVDPLEIFNVFVNILLEREKHIWIHPDLRAGKAIHKSYFTYAMGDIALCGYRNEDMCTNLLKRGVFHAALEHGTAPRVGTTIESALDYCRKMLQPMGSCERLLPSTYATWKIESAVQCHRPKFRPFVYENPGDGTKKSLLEVDYKARQRFESAQSTIFMVYKGSICGVWILLIVSQLRGVLKVLSWAVAIEVPFVKEPESGRREHCCKSSSDSTEVEDNGMTLLHKVVMIVVTLARIAMLLMLVYIGLSFLSRQTDYIGLLLDGVALVFIVEVQEIIYEKVIRADKRNEWDGAEPMTFPKFRVPYISDRPDRDDMIWLALVIILAFVFISHYTTTVVSPLLDALNCACRSDGDKCYEAHRFSKSFWDQYWLHDVPDTLTQINRLKAGLGH